MTYRTLGLTGVQVSPICLGAMNFGGCCKDQPGITSPIIGPRTMEQLDDALQVLEMQFADQDRARLDELVGPGNAVSDFHNSNNWMRARIAA